MEFGLIRFLFFLKQKLSFELMKHNEFDLLCKGTLNGHNLFG